jgi:4-aminobutyrate aminotransferase-like enzyme
MMRDQSWQSYSTFRGHPISVAAVRATVRGIHEQGLVERVASLDATMRSRMTQLASDHPSVERVDGLGLHWTMEFRGGDWRSWHADTDQPTVAGDVVTSALDQGVLIATSAEQASIFIAPPLVISDQELDTVIETLDRALVVADRSWT